MSREWAHQGDADAGELRRGSWRPLLSGRSLLRLLGCSALLAAYLALAEASYVFVFPPERNAVFWLPSGLTLALFLRAERARWPAWLVAIVLGEMLIVSRHGHPLPVIVAWGCANGLLPLAGALLLRGPRGPRFVLRSVGDVVRLVALGTLVGAIPGALVAGAAGATWIAGASIERMAIAWWSSDVLGVILLCPLFLAWAEPAEPRAGGAVEAAIMLAALSGVGWWVFASAQPRGLDAALPSLVLPLSAWAALRFGLRGATAVTILLDLVATWCTIQGRGPFAMVSADVASRVLNLQAYVSFLSLFILILAVVVAQEQRARSAAERAEHRSGFLARASVILSESLDFSARIAALSRLCVASLAEWCVIDVIEGGEVRRLSGAHRDPEKEGLLRELTDRYAPRAHSPQPAARVLRTGEPLLVPDLTDEVLRAHAVDDENARLVRALGARTLMAVPLTVRGQTIGAMTLVSSIPGCRYGPADLDLAHELARRAAISIDNARLYRDAQDAIRLRDEFLTVASHELNTPVTTLQLTVQALGRSAAQRPEVLAPALARAERQTKKVARLIGELLDVSRITAGRLHVELEDVDLSGLVREVADRFADDLSHARCALTLHADHPVIGRWDPLRLEQVVTNLLGNAIKFSAGCSIEVSVGEAAGIARLVVRDRGIGIPVDRLPYVFDRFERAVPARSYGGLGLGLYIVRGIVEALGGSIRVESVLGEGTIFTVDLPCAGPAGRAA
jgi:signal transduction histidine kinase